VAADLANYYLANPSGVPNESQIYVIPNINPDGPAGSGRFNANGVDLNRNWDTNNWTSNPPILGSIKQGGGGSRPFSEPETRLLRDLLMNLKGQGRKVIVIILHSSQRDRRDIYPGYTLSRVDPESAELAQRAARTLGFVYKDAGSDPTTGESLNWMADNGIASIDIFWSRATGNKPSIYAMAEVIDAMTR
jgi:hypothetical protein